MQSEDNKDDDATRPTVVNIHVADSKNIIIGSEIKGGRVDIGDIDNGSKSTKGTTTNWKNNIQTAIVIFSGVILIGVISYYSINNYPNNETSITAPQIDTSVLLEKSRPNTTIRDNRVGNASIYPSQNTPEEILFHVTVVGADEDRLKYNDLLVNESKSIFDNFAFVYSKKKDSGKNRGSISCTISFSQTPRRLGHMDNLLESRITLILNIKDRMGRQCYVRTFHSKSRTFDSTESDSHVIEACFDDLQQQIDYKIIKECFATLKE